MTRVLVAGGVAFLVMLVVGVDLEHCLLVGVVAGAVAAVRALPEVEPEHWPRRHDRRGDVGARRDVARLSWGLSGFESRVDRRGLLRLQALATRRLARLGVDAGSDDPAQQQRARELLGAVGWAVLRAEVARPPTFTDFARAVAAVERLPERPR